MLKIFGTTYGIDKKALVQTSRSAFTYLGEDFEVNLRIVSEAKIRELNRIYRNRDLATDVLSFKLDPSVLGGDVVICYKFAQKQAKKRGIHITNEASFLLVHAILHLAGYVHTKSTDRAKMEKAEKEILSKAK